MKLFNRIFLALSAILSGIRGHASTQNIQEMNDSLFKIVRLEVNLQNSDSIYALLNDNFKAKVSKDVFTGILKNNLYPLGLIKETSLLEYNDGVSSYKTVCAKTTIEFRISADTTGKISGLRFLPYKEVANKSYTVQTDNPMKTELDKQVDTIARRYINKVNTVGLSIGVLKDGATFVYGYGATAKENKSIPSPDAIFEIGSITKTFTATLLAYYVQKGEVSLSDPITRYLPDSVAANKELQQISLQMLANHTSGMERIPDNLLTSTTDMSNPYKYYKKEKLFSYLKTCKLQSATGEKYAYSNLAAGLLGTILETVSGKTYEEMITQVICTPLGMTNTMQHPDERQKQQQVKVYDDKGNPAIMWDMDALAGAGAIRSTTHDMLLYARANMEKNKSRMGKAMELTHTITYDKEMSIGLGWHQAKTHSGIYLWHNGGTGGSSSYIAFEPDKNIAVIVLSNAAESTDALGESILKVLEMQ